ncbi:TetR family transcriptional regulator [Thermobispora bispora]|jgi:AcrR family transcriptional regulator|uniref:Transcriptional regulator, TetR family n=1 Tax=Thermobispora bispora (strain ATCC 19993 / DSM 43833 / CBS 139.67 / JCM 10125 / KCTC 9307 / NBRC 14880 / R51) TaxID=469371 RepID=D6Y2L7_THEBD|nr:TetR/AcrR family transcriptional regulator [Thermobispora bispora]MBO2473450.1 TetR/AcrR family transcriptional regulator [Actinomycetales bacterium]MDI9582391.1 TetR/AcrR family transcriptional regulator [Thermobispora sp.]ADG88866.1 transcriptional regulator, TetR family [Thermobispora bispora DSM 43833]MBX6169701.1 TetR/AcrR family transcriptional regulator [Thermobispora bispora]QSI48624.1 TetR/AcrR family transcriptional regulator [Thermobispora bispora]
MSVVRPPTRNRRAEILQAAAVLFAERGFHKVSIEDIGAAVGVSGPALYRHFSGKEALLAEMLLDISERLRAQGERLAANANPEAALDALLDGHIDFALRHPELIRVHERELDNVPEPSRRAIRRLQRLYVEEWVTVLAELYPGCPSARLRAATHAVFGLLNSTPRTLGELAPEAMKELLHGMAKAAFASLGDAKP